MKQRALILGVTGQDGSYLTDLLLRIGYEVHGLVRLSSSLNPWRLQHLVENPAAYRQRFFLHYADLNDTTSLRRLLVKIAPGEVYHLAGQSHVSLSSEIPESTCETNAMATLRLLEILRDLPKSPRLFYASSSEIFGHPRQEPQDEHTPYAPINLYGCAKTFATQMVLVYRQSFRLFACNGIMYNHESPRRGENFVSRKICQGAAAIKMGLQEELILGDLDAERDWGDARDFVRGMWSTLQQEKPDDFVFATGRTHRVQDIVNVAFKAVTLDWRKYVKQDRHFMRLSEPRRLVGNPAKAKRMLNWEPTTTFEQLITEMTLAELALL